MDRGRFYGGQWWLVPRQPHRRPVRRLFHGRQPGPVHDRRSFSRPGNRTAWPGFRPARLRPVGSDEGGAEGVGVMAVTRLMKSFYPSLIFVR